MATIVERTRKDGSIAYVAQITRRAHTLQKSKTFPTRKAATAWAKKAEKEIDDAIAAGNDPSPATAKKITLGDAIDKYIHCVNERDREDQSPSPSNNQDGV